MYRHIVDAQMAYNGEVVRCIIYARLKREIHRATAFTDVNGGASESAFSSLRRRKHGRTVMVAPARRARVATRTKSG